MTTGHYSRNRVTNEMAANGIHSFYNAAVNSDLDYP
jgi:hypothetical protein